MNGDGFTSAEFAIQIFLKLWSSFQLEKKKKNYPSHLEVNEAKNKIGLTFSGKFLAMALCGMGSIQSKWIISLIVTSSLVTFPTPGT